jgi:hypothetical protein
MIQVSTEKPWLGRHLELWVIESFSGGIRALGDPRLHLRRVIEPLDRAFGELRNVDMEFRDTDRLPAKKSVGRESRPTDATTSGEPTISTPRPGLTTRTAANTCPADFAKCQKIVSTRSRLRYVYKLVIQSGNQAIQAQAFHHTGLRSARK